jgi:hypothetical protein
MRNSVGRQMHRGPGDIGGWCFGLGNSSNSLSLLFLPSPQPHLFFSIADCCCCCCCCCLIDRPIDPLLPSTTVCELLLLLVLAPPREFTGVALAFAAVIGATAFYYLLPRFGLAFMSSIVGVGVDVDGVIVLCCSPKTQQEDRATYQPSIDGATASSFGPVPAFDWLRYRGLHPDPRIQPMGPRCMSMPLSLSLAVCL